LENWRGKDNKRKKEKMIKIKKVAEE